MAKRANLNGLPHNLTKSFFGTNRYHGPGYMADWVLAAARKSGLAEFTIDILNETLIPNTLNMAPVTSNIKDLKAILYHELVQNGFEKDFIQTATIRLEFSSGSDFPVVINCYPLLVDKEGRQYKVGPIQEAAYEADFVLKKWWQF